MTSSFSLVGDANATVATLSSAPVQGSSDITTLSTVNYPNNGSPVPNEANQQVFMNQPLSWWISELNSGKIKYTPVSGDVNWSYTNDSGSEFHIGRSVTTLIIPDRTQSSQMDSATMTSTVVFEPKFGVSRTDTCKL